MEKKQKMMSEKKRTGATTRQQIMSIAVNCKMDTGYNMDTPSKILQVKVFFYMEHIIFKYNTLPSPNHPVQLCQFLNYVYEQFY